MCRSEHEVEADRKQQILMLHDLVRFCSIIQVQLEVSTGGVHGLRMALFTFISHVVRAFVVNPAASNPVMAQRLQCLPAFCSRNFAAGTTEQHHGVPSSSAWIRRAASRAVATPSTKACNCQADTCDYLACEPCKPDR